MTNPHLQCPLCGSKAARITIDSFTSACTACGRTIRNKPIVPANDGPLGLKIRALPVGLILFAPAIVITIYAIIPRTEHGGETWFNIALRCGRLMLATAILWPIIVAIVVSHFRKRRWDVGTWTARRIIVRGIVGTLAFTVLVGAVLLGVALMGALAMSGI